MADENESVSDVIARHVATVPLPTDAEADAARYIMRNIFCRVGFDRVMLRVIERDAEVEGPEKCLTDIASCIHERLVRMRQMAQTPDASSVAVTDESRPSKRKKRAGADERHVRVAAPAEVDAM